MIDYYWEWSFLHHNFNFHWKCHDCWGGSVPSKEKKIYSTFYPCQKCVCVCVLINTFLWPGATPAKGRTWRPAAASCRRRACSSPSWRGALWPSTPPRSRCSRWTCPRCTAGWSKTTRGPTGCGATSWRWAHPKSPLPLPSTHPATLPIGPSTCSNSKPEETTCILLPRPKEYQWSRWIQNGRNDCASGWALCSVAAVLVVFLLFGLIYFQFWINLK